MIDPVVRRAIAADVDELARLERESRAALVDQRGGARWLEVHAPVQWDAAIAEDRVHLGTIDEVPVGFIVVVRADTVLSIETVYVTPQARELGFGDTLLAVATDYGRAIGATWLEAEALPGDRATKNLYERAGITARSITVSTRLKP